MIPPPAGVRSARRKPWVFVALTTAAAGLVLPFAAHRVGPQGAFLPVVLAVVACFDLLSVYLLTAQFREGGDRRLLGMSLAYLFSLVLMLGYAGAFPGVVAPRGPLGTSPSVAPWLYVCWHAGFPVALGLAWAPWPRAWQAGMGVAARRRAAWLSQALVAAAAAALVGGIVTYGRSLPLLIQGVDTSRMTAVTAPVALPLALLSLLTCAWALRHHAGPERWTSVAVWVAGLDLVLTYLSRYRYSLGWYAGRSLTVVAAGIVVMSMISEMTRVGKALAISEANLAAVAQVVRRIRTGEDAREATVAAALSLSGAAAALLVEPDARGRLQVTALAHRDPTGELWPFDPEAPGCPVREVSGGGGCRYVTGDPVLGPPGARAALWQPVVTRGAVTAVLAVFWALPLRDPAARAFGALELLADEAAVALEHDQLLVEYARLAGTDGLTGLPNRRAWDDGLRRRMSAARRQGIGLVVALVDLDHFKAYNDEYGHQRGDDLLRRFASGAASVLRADDLLARWGGEEFALCLSVRAEGEAEAVLLRVLATRPAGRTCSVGFAVWDGTESGADLLGRADAALYQAKAGGRDRVVRAEEVLEAGRLVLPRA